MRTYMLVLYSKLAIARIQYYDLDVHTRTLQHIAAMIYVYDTIHVRYAYRVAIVSHMDMGLFM